MLYIYIVRLWQNRDIHLPPIGGCYRAPDVMESDVGSVTTLRRFHLNLILYLTHWGRDKMAAIWQTTLSIAFSWMKMLVFRLNFHWSLFLRVQLTIFQHWFRLWLGAVQTTSHYLNQWWLVYRRIYASLGLNELIWAYVSGKSLLVSTYLICLTES